MDTKTEIRKLKEDVSKLRARVTGLEKSNTELRKVVKAINNKKWH